VGSDPHIQIVDYDPDQIVQIAVAQGYQVTVQFGADERIENVAVGDSAVWQVTANHRGDLLFVKPVQSDIATNLTVATDSRLYAFELTPLFDASPDMAYTIRFNYPAPAGAAPQADAASAGQTVALYRVSGARALRPSRISDDGVHTYIEWPARRPLPAVYTKDVQGHEALVNGHMRDGQYVIDAVLAELVFRIDRHVARARRLPPEGTR
jgi:type IV secretion system protein VirB9